MKAIGYIYDRGVDIDLVEQQQSIDSAANKCGIELVLTTKNFGSHVEIVNFVHIAEQLGASAIIVADHEIAKLFVGTTDCTVLYGNKKVEVRSKIELVEVPDVPQFYPCSSTEIVLENVCPHDPSAIGYCDKEVSVETPKNSRYTQNLLANYSEYKGEILSMRNNGRSFAKITQVLNAKYNKRFRVSTIEAAYDAYAKSVAETTVEKKPVIGRSRNGLRDKGFFNFCNSYQTLQKYKKFAGLVASLRDEGFSFHYVSNCIGEKHGLDVSRHTVAKIYYAQKDGAFDKVK